MMDHLQLKAVLAVIVFQGCEAVRTLSDNLSDPFLYKGSHVLFGHPVEDIFIAKPADTVTAAFFILAEDAPGYSGLVQQLRHGNTHMFAAGIERTGAADIKQIFGGLFVEHLHIDLTAPF